MQTTKDAVRVPKRSLKKILIIGVTISIVASIIGLSVGLTLNKRKNNSNQQAEKFSLANHILIDGHNDLSYMIRENFRNQFEKFDLNDLTNTNLPGTKNVTHTDLIRLKKGLLGGQFWAVYADCSTQGKDAVRVHLEQLETLIRLFRKHPSVFQLTGTVAEIRDAFKSGKIASMFGLESGHAIDSSLSMLRVFYELGVRYMTLTHNCNTPWADNNKVDSNATAPKHNGLTQFGKLVVREMNRLGMIVDLSHVSKKVMLDALEVTKAPVMFSHSSVWDLCNHTRNVQKDVLDKLKLNKGVIMINFYNAFITCKSKATLQDVKNHINYVKNTIGVDYVGIGGDYDGVDSVPEGLEDVSKYPDLFASLEADGWSKEELAKLAGENILRVLSDNEKYAEEIKNEPPIDEIIDQEFIESAGFKNCRISF